LKKGIWALLINEILFILLLDYSKSPQEFKPLKFNCYGHYILLTNSVN